VEAYQAQWIEGENRKAGSGHGDGQDSFVGLVSWRLVGKEAGTGYLHLLDQDFLGQALLLFGVGSVANEVRGFRR
jgi:hypothetical protein